MTVVTNEHGQTNVFAKEPQMYISEEDQMQHEKMPYAERAEFLNAQWAIIGVIAGVISYVATGKLFFGLY
jgi:alkyl sulfatase BDS1-like metallo-beta-lactamase superfamily hydrolase